VHGLSRAAVGHLGRAARLVASALAWDPARLGAALRRSLEAASGSVASARAALDARDPRADDAISAAGGRLLDALMEIGRFDAGGPRSQAEDLSELVQEAASACLDAEAALDAQRRRAAPAASVIAPRAGANVVRLQSLAEVERYVAAHGHLAGVTVEGVRGVPRLTHLDLSASRFEDCDFSGADLERVRARATVWSSCRLVGLRASGASFAESDLSDARLEDADLTGASFEGARLWRTHLERSHLVGSRWEAASLRDAVLHDARAAGVDFGAAIVRNPSVRGADLESASFRRATLQDVDLTGVRLRGAKLICCLLTGAHGEDVDLTSADLTDTTLKNALLPRLRGAGLNAPQSSWAGADLRGAQMQDASLPFADVRGVDFEGADLSRASFHGSCLVNANLSRVIAREARFDDARLERARMAGSSFAGASFAGADLSHAILDGSTLVGGSLAAANLHRTSFESADRTHVDMRDARTTDEDRARAEDFGKKAG